MKYQIISRSDGVTMLTLTEKLLPCPFCGYKANFCINTAPEDENYNGEWIECERCGASTNIQFSAMDNCQPLLVEKWNQRISGTCDGCGQAIALPSELCEECKGV